MPLLVLVQRMPSLGGVGLGWVGLGWVGLGWVGLGWVGLGWVGLRLVELGWCGVMCRAMSYQVSGIYLVYCDVCGLLVYLLVCCRQG